MTASKHRKSRIANVALAPVGGAHPLPTVSAPTPPVGWVPVKLGSNRNVAPPLKAQVDQAAAAAEELRASRAYAEFLGDKVPPGDGLADALEFSAHWSREVVAAEAWAAFAKSQAHLAWTFTLGQLEAVKAPLALESARDPKFANELLAFKSLVTARTSSAKRAVANREARIVRASTKATTKPTTPPAPAPEGVAGAARA